MKRINLRDKAWLTPGEAMKFLGWSRLKVWKHVTEGHFDAVRDGGSDKNPRYKISVESITRFVNGEAERLRRLANGEDAA